MSKFFLSILILFIISVSFHYSYAEQDYWNQQLYDAVRIEDVPPHYFVVDLEQIKLSLANGANPNWIKSEEGKDESILSHYVSITSSSASNPEIDKKTFKAIELLFEHGAKLQSHDDAILFSPIATGKYELVKLLLEKGASATSWPTYKIGGRSYNFTPIEVATAHGHEKIVELLTSYGAKKLDKEDAVQVRFIEVACSGRVSELIEQLEKGANINTRNRNGETALINALFGLFLPTTEKYEKIMYLLDAGADVNLEGKGFGLGLTLPLHEAIYQSQFVFRHNRDPRDPRDPRKVYAEKILQALIKKGAYISGRDRDDKTPLHIAAEYNHLYAAELLLKSGAKVMPKDKKGKTPLDYAESSEMIKLLKKYGAKEQ